MKDSAELGVIGETQSRNQSKSISSVRLHDTVTKTGKNDAGGHGQLHQSLGSLSSYPASQCPAAPINSLASGGGGFFLLYGCRRTHHVCTINLGDDRAERRLKTEVRGTENISISCDHKTTSPMEAIRVCCRAIFKGLCA